MARPAPEQRLTVDEYLQRERAAAERHEYADGRLFAMAGASDTHSLIVFNAVMALGPRVRAQGCRLYSESMKLRALERVFYYPDLMVVCAPGDDEPYFKRHPCLILEVLSPSTETVDRGEKLFNYRQIATLQMYVLVHQERARVEVYQRGEGDRWTYEVLDREGQLSLPCPGGPLALSDLYDGVVFPA